MPTAGELSIRIAVLEEKLNRYDQRMEKMESFKGWVVILIAIAAGTGAINSSIALKALLGHP